MILLDKIKRKSESRVYALAECVSTEGKDILHACAGLHGDSGYCGVSAVSIDISGKDKLKVLDLLLTWYTNIVFKAKPSIIVVDTSMLRKNSPLSHDISSILVASTMVHQSSYSSGGAINSISKYNMDEALIDDITGMDQGTDKVINCLCQSAALAENAHRIMSLNMEDPCKIEM